MGECASARRRDHVNTSNLLYAHLCCLNATVMLLRAGGFMACGLPPVAGDNKHFIDLAGFISLCRIRNTSNPRSQASAEAERHLNSLTFKNIHPGFGFASIHAIVPKLFTKKRNFLKGSIPDLIVIYLIRTSFPSEMPRCMRKFAHR